MRVEPGTSYSQVKHSTINSSHASCDFWRLPIAFANNLDPTKTDISDMYVYGHTICLHVISVSARVHFLRFWRNKLTADALTVCLWVFRDLWKIDLHTNIFAGYFHDVSDLFQKRRLLMSKVICDSHRWGFAPNNFRLFRSRCYFGALCSINFEKSSLEEKVFFAPIHQNI